MTGISIELNCCNNELLGLTPGEITTSSISEILEVSKTRSVDKFNSLFSSCIR